MLNSYSCKITLKILILWFILIPKLYANGLENNPKGALSLTKKVLLLSLTFSNFVVTYANLVVG
jgi:hypothetical protein